MDLHLIGTTAILSISGREVYFAAGSLWDCQVGAEFQGRRRAGRLGGGLAHQVAVLRVVLDEGRHELAFQDNPELLATYLLFASLLLTWTPALSVLMVALWHRRPRGSTDAASSRCLPHGPSQCRRAAQSE